MKEDGKLIGAIRNATVAAAIIPFGIATNSLDIPTSIQSASNAHHLVLDEKPPTADDSFLTQLDEFVETDSGTAFATAFWVTTLAMGYYRYKKTREIDSDRKVFEADASSLFLLAFSTTLLAEVFVDARAEIPAAFLTGFTIAQAAYMIESTLESDRDWKKISPAFAAAAGFLALNAVILADTITKS